MAEINSKRAECRHLIEIKILSDADFNAFCMDNYNHVFRRFSQGMERQEKINLLLTLVEPEEIIQRLQSVNESVDSNSNSAINPPKRRSPIKFALILINGSGVVSILFIILFHVMKISTDSRAIYKTALALANSKQIVSYPNEVCFPDFDARAIKQNSIEFVIDSEIEMDSASLKSKGCNYVQNSTNDHSVDNSFSSGFASKKEEYVENKATIKHLARTVDSSQVSVSTLVESELRASDRLAKISDMTATIQPVVNGHKSNWSWVVHVENPKPVTLNFYLLTNSVIQMDGQLVKKSHPVHSFMVKLLPCAPLEKPAFAAYFNAILSLLLLANLLVFIIWVGIRAYVRIRAHFSRA